MAAVTIIINGDEKTVDHGATVADVVQEMGAGKGRVAVLVNGDVIPLDARDTHRLLEGDRVEVIGFAAGG